MESVCDIKYHHKIIICFLKLLKFYISKYIEGKQTPKSDICEGRNKIKVYVE